MKVTLHLYNSCFSDHAKDWYWVLKTSPKMIFEDIVGIKDYKLKFSAVRAAKAFAKKHNFIITKEFENE